MARNWLKALATVLRSSVEREEANSAMLPNRASASALLSRSLPAPASRHCFE